MIFLLSRAGVAASATQSPPPKAAGKRSEQDGGVAFLSNFLALKNAGQVAVTKAVAQH
jgi:hypothetical protein